LYLKGKRSLHNQNKPPFNKDDFEIFFDDVQASKRDIYKKLKDKKGVYMSICLLIKSIIVVMWEVVLIYQKEWQLIFFMQNLTKKQT
jgi:hypothetical protein